MYQPALFLPIDLVERMNAVIDPLEVTMKNLASHPSLNPLMKPLLDHNLEQLNKFKQQQQSLLSDYLDAKHTKQF